ncbi:hypothetical protein C1645_6296 [Glomus cerebriforme]|uniref:HMG box domain-containing protein n=1 Tax=Glomus cerebriforme TaxID=658196 RepID=A0A397SD03_9GLOM|nr:hypothetical protein C1645_6296 [Glomus cerebriforme]
MVLYFHDELISSESHPLVLNPPYVLTLSIKDLTTPKDPKEFIQVSDHSKKKRRQKSIKAVAVIPRPHNAFIIFRNDYAAKVKRMSNQQKISIRLISKMASRQWKQESDVVKLFFKLLADMYQQRHKVIYPNYKFSPKINSTNNVKKGKSNIKSRKDNKKKGRIITWYIHDNIEKMLRNGDNEETDTFRYTDLNINNQEDLDKYIQVPEQKTNYPVPSVPATFINYTASPSTPLILHSTTTTASSTTAFNSPPPTPPTNFNYYNENNNNSSTLYDASLYDDNASPQLGFIPLETSSSHSSPPSDSSDDCLFWADTSNNNGRDVSLSPYGFSLFNFGDEQNLFEI